jgi:hypothetical protein
MQYSQIFGNVPDELALGVVSAVAGTVAGFEFGFDRPLHNGVINRKTLPKGGELVGTELHDFQALADCKGSPAEALRMLWDLDGRLALKWFGSVSEGKVDFVGLSREAGRWMAYYSVASFNGNQALAFLRDLQPRVPLPIRIPGDAIWDIQHSLGLAISNERLPRTVEWELPEATLEAALKFIADFSAALALTPKTLSWGLKLEEGAPREEVSGLYDAVLEKKIPHTAATLIYDFRLDELERISELHRLCQKGEDAFIVQLGTFPHESGVSVELSDEIGKKGHRFRITMDDANDVLDLPARGALVERLKPLLQPKTTDPKPGKR